VAVKNFPKIGDKRAVRISQHEFEDSSTNNQLASFIVETLVFLLAFMSSTKAFVELFFAFKQGVNFIGGFLPGHDGMLAAWRAQA